MRSTWVAAFAVLLGAISLSARAFDWEGAMMPRVEGKASARLLIAPGKDGSGYFRAVNIGERCIRLTVRLEKYEDLTMGGIVGVDTEVELGPYENGRPVSYESLDMADGWVARWTTTDNEDSPACRASETPTDRDPSVIFRRPPRYPQICEDAANSRETVFLRYIVSELGDVKNARVTSSTNPCFEDAALEALKSWRFAPKLVNGRPVIQTFIDTQITFELTE